MKRIQRVGFMVIKGWLVERDFNARGLTVRDFADALGIEMREAYKLLSGEKIGIGLARKFVMCDKIDKAMKYIDWHNMNEVKMAA